MNSFAGNLLGFNGDLLGAPDFIPSSNSVPWFQTMALGFLKYLDVSLLFPKSRIVRPPKVADVETFMLLTCEIEKELAKKWLEDLNKHSVLLRYSFTELSG